MTPSAPTLTPEQRRHLIVLYKLSGKDAAVKAFLKTQPGEEWFIPPGVEIFHPCTGSAMLHQGKLMYRDKGDTRPSTPLIIQSHILQHLLGGSDHDWK